MVIYFCSGMNKSFYVKLVFSVAFVVFCCIAYTAYTSKQPDVANVCTEKTVIIYKNVTLPCNDEKNIPTQTVPIVNNNNNNQNSSADVKPISEQKGINNSEDYLVVVGIPTTATTTERRMQIRLTYIRRYKEVYCPYCTAPHPNPKVRVLFFIGKVTEGLDLLQAEQEMFGDMVFLDVTEAMNEGKTFYVLSWLTQNTRARYIMKADDDSFLVIPNLVKRLEHYSPHLSDSHIYYGFSIFERPSTRNVFMAGMGYVLDFNLTKALVSNPNQAKSGPEDLKVSHWVHWAMERGTKVIQIGNTRHFHDTPHHTGVVSWEYNCQDVLLHQVKTTLLFNEAANYYLHCCGANKPYAHPICTAKVTSNTLCNNSTTRGIDCYHLKLHTVQTVEAVDNDVFIRDDDLEL